MIIKALPVWKRQVRCREVQLLLDQHGQLRAILAYVA